MAVLISGSVAVTQLLLGPFVAIYSNNSRFGNRRCYLGKIAASNNWAE